MTVVSSVGGTVATTDGGKTWQVVISSAANEQRERLVRKISAQHQGAVETPQGRTAAYPNPARGLVSITYGIEQPGEVSVALHDNCGGEVLRANEGPRATGEHTLQLDTTPLADGVYFYRIISGGRIIAGSTVIVSH